MSVILIAGPTASGKSALAVALARQLNGIVVNADASQAYDCWSILSARPGPEELTAVPHRLYGHVSGHVRYSTGEWLRDVAQVLDEARRTEQTPIIVGGTGLYFHALTMGLADIPAIPAEVRTRSQAFVVMGALDQMIADLKQSDPATLARIDQNNPMRVQRAWDVLTGTGRGLAAWQDATPPPLLTSKACSCIVLSPDISFLNKRIEERFHIMLEYGAVNEARAFAAMQIAPDMPAARVLGGPQLIAHLRGEIDLASATDSSIVATRQFAKRQRTWFRNRMAGWNWIDPDQRIDALVDQVTGLNDR